MNFPNPLRDIASLPTPRKAIPFANDAIGFLDLASCLSLDQVGLEKGVNPLLRSERGRIAQRREGNPVPLGTWALLVVGR